MARLLGFRVLVSPLYVGGKRIELLVYLLRKVPVSANTATCTMG